MVNRPKDIGTRGETAVVKAARACGFGCAERRALAGSADVGDVLLCPGVIVEVKAGQQTANPSDRQVAAWIAETVAEQGNARADVALLVLRRPGKGDAAAWWAYMLAGQLVDLAQYRADPLAAAPGWCRPEVDALPVRLLLRDALTVLRAAGYGDPLDPFTFGSVK